MVAVLVALFVAGGGPWLNARIGPIVISAVAHAVPDFASPLRPRPGSLGRSGPDSNLPGDSQSSVAAAPPPSQFSTGVTWQGSPDDYWIEISLAERKLRLRGGTQVFMEVPVAVGKAATPTPTGQFEVMEMVEDPIWQDPFNPKVVYPEKDPRNPLGKRWIGFKQAGDNDYGMHGTNNLDSIGKAITNGCVRLRNEHIVELYEQVDEGTPVVIHP